MTDWLLSDEQRTELLNQLFQYHEVYTKIAQNKGVLEPISEAIQQLIEQYKASLPVLSLSRCPFTGELVHMAIDNKGLDGLWWNYNSPKRPIGELPRTFFAFDGAMCLDSELEHTPYLCSPGPSLPFVVPRLLSYIQVKAVLSTLSIGKHTGYIIMYFADPFLEECIRINDWGTERYFDGLNTFNNTITPGNYIEAESDELDYDFDLEPWIKSGKLLWIEPGDMSLTLKSVVSKCPYLNKEGNKSIQYIQLGEVWTDSWEEHLDSEDEEEKDVLDLEEYLSILEEAERR
jgi:hypothetical protein